MVTAMGLFGRKTKPVALPADIVAQMARYGQDRWNLKYGIFDPGPWETLLRSMPTDEQRAWISALSDVVVPVGGWASYGAEDTVMKAMGNPVDLPAYCAILDAALGFQRSAGVWEAQLSPNEIIYWRTQHPGELWLAPADPPAREMAVITDLAVGQERRVAVMSKIPDSNEVYASRPEAGRYVAIVEAPVERGTDRGRVRNEADSTGSLYDLYYNIGQQMRLPNHWVDPELEPFFPFACPKI